MSKGGFMKDAVILFVITLIAGVCLGGVYTITKEPIAKAQQEAKEAAYRAVFPGDYQFSSSDEIAAAIPAANEALAGMGYGNVLVSEAVEVVDGSGAAVGSVVSATSKDGFGGAVSISVGIDLDGTVKGIEFLSLSETPGLGMNATKPAFKDQFSNKKAESFTVTKSGAASDSEIDAMSGATITSNAVTNAVNAAVYFADNCMAQ